MKFTVNADSPENLRLAYRFWIELGRPARFHNRKTLEAWSAQMDGLYRKSGFDYDDFKWFLIWALRLDDPDGARYGNNFTAKNLRSACDPMASLVKQFDFTFFEVFQPKADKVLPLLIRKRQQEEAGTEEATSCSEAAIASTSSCETCADEEHRAGGVERCTRCGQTDFTTFLCLDCLDNGQRKATLEYLMWVEYDNQHEGRKAGEAITDWIDRVFAPLRDPDWRCPNCAYGGDPDPDAKRTAWCPDCAEERRMYADEDRECMCGEPSNTPSALDSPDMLPDTSQDEPWGEKVSTKARRALLDHTVEMYNKWLAAPVDGSRIAVSDLSGWAQTDDLNTIIWLAGLNRDGKTRDHFPNSRAATPRFTRLSKYLDTAHPKAVESHARI